VSLGGVARSLYSIKCEKIVTVLGETKCLSDFLAVDASITNSTLAETLGDYAIPVALTPSTGGSTIGQPISQLSQR
jgi:hypothetical protein